MLCITLLSLLPFVYPVKAQTFVAPSTGHLTPSANWGHPSNGSLATQPVVTGKVFDRFIEIMFENTDFSTASSTPAFAALAQQGITLTNYLALTHPSEPNYAGMVGGDFWGMADDNLHSIPSNISTIVDLLEGAGISWAAYEESMANDGDTAFSESQHNYRTGSGTATYYVRKHNPLILYNSVSGVPSRAARIRNFNDFVADITASAVPQWLFVTPNLVDDGHDTSASYAGSWIDFFINPLLSDTRFNNNRTLILLTFDENETSGENNFVFSVLLGGAVPTSLQGTTDNTLYSHYSALSTVESNWGLGCLGRHDADKTLGNVFSFVADVTGYQNTQVTNIPLTNSSGTTPGPLNPNNPTPWTGPDTSAVCPGGGPVI